MLGARAALGLVGLFSVWLLISSPTSAQTTTGDGKSTPTTSAELPSTELSDALRGELARGGIPNASLGLFFDTNGNLVGAAFPESKKERLRPGPPPRAVNNIRGLGNFSILAYQGSNCYLIRGPDGTLYYMPPGCS
ncbi:hypothetical protein [Skermanella stibiiresistens]|uniref:hypothetical protein n=1 Tax=Skermanella stibiiresistens TaxID=913326 RepID=UPI0012F91E41|nr:hypothetical protein [Skermanella stibiiresistens]